MSALTITRNGTTVREEYDETDPAQVATMRAKFDAITGGALRYATTAAGTQTLHRGEFPEEAAEVVVQPQYQGG